jgi:hypothetical protein
MNQKHTHGHLYYVEHSIGEGPCMQRACRARNAPLSFEEVKFLARKGEWTFLKNSITQFQKNHLPGGVLVPITYNTFQVGEVLDKGLDPVYSFEVEAFENWPISPVLQVMNAEFERSGIRQKFEDHASNFLSFLPSLAD